MFFLYFLLGVAGTGCISGAIYQFALNILDKDKAFSVSSLAGFGIMCIFLSIIGMLPKK